MAYDYYCDKHTKRRVPKTVARRRKRQFVTLLISLLLVLGICTGGTLAYVLTHTDATENVFTPGKVSCSINETFSGNVKSNVSVKNTGNTDAYIRAYISVTWMKDDEALNQTVTARTPVENEDYTIAFSQNTGWLKGSDGYWYYCTPVSADSSTGALIDQCKLKDGVSAPEGYHLSVEIIASAIQASPDTVVTSHWGVTLDGNRIISAGKSEVIGE